MFTYKKLFWLSLIGFGMIWAIRVEAKDLYVPGSYTTIQAAITAAKTGDTVWVANGIYTGPGNKGLSWSGKKITVRSVSGNPDKCIIECENSGRAFYFARAGDCGTISGFTITRGEADYGGGIWCANSSPSITNCTISKNSAGAGGGIGCLANSSPSITNCTISENSAGAGGGIGCSANSSPTITNCIISGNSAGDEGGGIWCLANSSPSITNCIISGNSVGDRGGGIYCGDSSSPTITNCIMSGNSARYSGGGIYCWDSSPTITNCTISGNEVSHFGCGGIGCLANSSPTITNCIISGNSAGEEGGGIGCSNSSPTITNCTIWNNSPRNYSGCSLGRGNISADPLFISSNDFHLRANSPCIDKGSNTAPGIPTTDKDGKPRIVNGRVDMGAYEFQGTTNK